MKPVVALLPDDWLDAILVGRIATSAGPTPIVLRKGVVEDMSAIAPTVSLLVASSGPIPAGRALGPAETVLSEAAALLPPVDLQCIKAAGVTFAVSAIERVIEERARGSAHAAANLRDDLESSIGVNIRAVVPGSPEAESLKAVLIKKGLWSQYLEVAIGPDAEVFTKAPVLSSVGPGAAIGVRSDSSWNNPEPEIAIAVDPTGRAIGATLGNDVNLRDFEGRSALLLGKAKDNNASCALGPFIRLFDEGFTMDHVRGAVVELTIEGEDGFRLSSQSTMAEISRDPANLIAQTLSDHHYPDGFVLFLGTLFAPTQDRDVSGSGFTHKEGDIVRISTPRLGVLENRVTSSTAAPPWSFGISDLMFNLAQRGLLTKA